MIRDRIDVLKTDVLGKELVSYIDGSFPYAYTDNKKPTIEDIVRYSNERVFADEKRQVLIDALIRQYARVGG